MVVVLINGAPGSGKSTLLKNLKPHFSQSAFVEIDDLREMIYPENWLSGFGRKRALKVANSMLQTWKAEGVGLAFIADSMGKEDRETFVKSLPKSWSIFTFVLLVSDEVIGRRISNRSKGFKNVAESLRRNRKYHNESSENVQYLEVSNLSQEEVVQQILDQFSTSYPIEGQSHP